jgi:hypothetical protein
MAWRLALGPNTFNKVLFGGEGGPLWRPTATETIHCTNPPSTTTDQVDLLGQVYPPDPANPVANGLSIAGNKTDGGDTWTWNLTSPK